MTDRIEWLESELDMPSQHRGGARFASRLLRDAVTLCGLLVAAGCAGADEIVENDSPYDDDPKAENVSMTEAALSGSVVGIVRGVNAACPGGLASISYFFDNEDSNNNNSRSGWIGANVSNRNTTLTFCPVNGDAFRQIRSGSAGANYAVLKLSASCPPGSVQFTRYFDDEDDRSDCPVSTTDPGGNFLVCTNNTINFCMFRANPSAPSFAFPEGGTSYGVLGGASLPGTLESGNLYMDNEDSSNNNSVSGDTVGISTFMTVGSNTRIFFSRVK